ncbi:MAG: NUDIX hydrolase [Caulobacteraceae bacterium]|nr:NUDIX hydrolase [Caulobacteraceae bacterium]
MPLKPRAARPRHAASLILIRRTAKGPEVLMGRRPRRSAFAPNVFVFPGGAVEPDDYAARPVRPLDPACARRTGASPRLAEALAAAALRETREETGLVLPADHGALALVARAITPTMSPIRFHARFFLADAETAAGDHADSHELSDLAFRPLAEAQALALMDVTEAVLAAVAEAERPAPFLFSYRGGKPARRPLP